MMMNVSDGSTRRNGSGRPTIANMNLSYVDMNIGPDGSVLNQQQICDLRARQGYCTRCRGVPVRLFDIKKSRLNPLWSSKAPRTVEGEVLEGQCLVCFPHLDPNYRSRRGSARVNHHHRGPHQGYAQSPGTRNRPTIRGQPPSPDTGRRSNGSASSGLSRSGGGGPVLPPPSSENAIVVAAEEVRRMTRERERLIGDDADASEMATRRGAGASLSNASSFRSIGNSESARGSDGAFDGLPQAPDLIIDAEVVPADALPLSIPTLPENNNSGRLPATGGGQSGDEEVDDGQNDVDDDIDDERSRVSDSFELLYESQRSRSIRRDIRQPSYHGPVMNGGTGRIAGQLASAGSVPTPNHTNLMQAIQETPNSNIDNSSQPRQIQQQPPVSASVESSVSPSPADYATMVLSLEALIKDLSAAGNADFTSDVLVNAMQESPESVEIQQFCLSAIWDLCKDNDSYKKSLITTTAPDDILKAMKNHLSSRSIQERGCGALWSLSVNKNNRIIVVRAGAPFRVVCAMLEFPNDENVVRTAVGALRTLSPEKEFRESVGVGREVTRQVAEAMERHRTVASIQRDGCAFLSNSAVDLEHQTVAVATKEEMMTIVKAMRQHRDEPSVMSGACFALKNYTHEEKNLETLTNCDGALELLQHAAEYAQEAACKEDANIVLERIQLARMEEDSIENQALASLTSLVQQEPVPLNSVNTVLAVIQEHPDSERLIAHGLLTLMALVNQSQRHLDRINSTEVQGIVRIMQDHQSESESAVQIQVQACTLLKALASNDIKMRHNIIESQGCVAIASAIRRHHSDMELLIAAAGALKTLSMEFECWFEMERSGDLATVREVIGGQTESTVLQQLAADIFTNFSGYSDVVSTSA